MEATHTVTLIHLCQIIVHEELTQQQMADSEALVHAHLHKISHVETIAFHLALQASLLQELLHVVFLLVQTELTWVIAALILTTQDLARSSRE